MRRFRRGSTPEPTREGWPDVDDTMPSWTATIALSWTWPSLNWVQLVLGLVLGATLIVVAISFPADRQPWAGLIFGLMAAVFLWDPARALWALRSRTRMTLVLEPQQLTLALDNGTDPFVLRRDAAAWLNAAEWGADSFTRELHLVDASGRGAIFVAGRAAVEVRLPGVPPVDRLTGRMPVATLLGEWWPHPARRMSRRGMVGVRRHWAESDLDSYPRRDRRDRWQQALLGAFFAVLCLVLAADPGAGPLTRTAAAAACVVLTVWAVRVARRPPLPPAVMSPEARTG